MAVVISTWALVLAGQAEVDGQTARDSTQRARMGASREQPRDQRSWARPDARRDDRATSDCAIEMREYARRRDEFETWLRKQHIEWHRLHDGERDNWIRQHQALHGVQDRTRQEWARRNPAPRCARQSKH
jgi:hypothetical protein